jgi:hypothetical protein
VHVEREIRKERERKREREREKEWVTGRERERRGERESEKERETGRERERELEKESKRKGKRKLRKEREREYTIPKFNLDARSICSVGTRISQANHQINLQTMRGPPKKGNFPFEILRDSAVRGRLHVSDFRYEFTYNSVHDLHTKGLGFWLSFGHQLQLLVNTI